MRQSLAELCSCFLDNRNAVKAAFAWESVYLYPVCAAILTDRRVTADVEQLRRCRDLLKARTGVFSNFRSTAKLAMIAMMAADSDPEGKLERALLVYDALKEHFWGSQYLPVAAMALSDAVPPEQYEDVAERTRSIYNRMREEHPFLTCSEDSVFAAMLALSPLEDEQIIAETERCYRLLKPEFFSGNAVQSLSHALALGEGGAEEKCAAVLRLYRELKRQGYPYGTGYELATLGVLALLPADPNAVLTDVMQTDDHLSEQKGYGLFGPGRKQRIMHAGMLVVSDYIGPSDTVHTAALGGTLALIAAQQCAVCAAVAASSAAAASHSGGTGGN